MDSQLDATII